MYRKHDTHTWQDDWQHISTLLINHEQAFMIHLKMALSHSKLRLSPQYPFIPNYTPASLYKELKNMNNAP